MRVGFRSWLIDHAKGGEDIDDNIAKLARVSTMDPNFPEDGSVMTYVKYFVQAKAPQAVITALEKSFALYAPFKDWLKDAAEFVVDGHIVDKIHKMANADESFPVEGTYQDFLDHLEKKNAPPEAIEGLKETFKHYSMKLHSNTANDPVDVPEEYRADPNLSESKKSVPAKEYGGGTEYVGGENADEKNEVIGVSNLPLLSTEKNKTLQGPNVNEGFADLERCSNDLKLRVRLPFKEWLLDESAHGELSSSNKEQIKKLAILAKADDFLGNSSKKEYEDVMKSHKAPQKAFDALDTAYSIFAPFKNWLGAFAKKFKGKANSPSKTSDFLTFLKENHDFPRDKDVKSMKAFLKACNDGDDHLKVLDKMVECYELSSPAFNYGVDVPSSLHFDIQRGLNKPNWVKQKPRKFQACANSSNSGPSKAVQNELGSRSKMAKRSWKVRHPELFSYPVLAEKIYKNVELMRFLPKNFSERVSNGELFDEGVLLDVVKQRENNIPEDVVSSFCYQALSSGDFPVRPMISSPTISVRELYLEGQVGNFTLRRQQNSEASLSGRGSRHFNTGKDVVPF